jgi:peptidyl-prolyl cis-trans isomerase D
MLSTLRHFSGTWPARIFFLILGASFASWGIADVVRNLGAGSGAIATVGGHDITPAQFQQEFQIGWRRVVERFPDPSQIPPDMRHSVAQQTLDKLVTQQALADEVKRLALTVPDSAVRQSVFSTQGFQGPDGSFSRPIFLQLLQNNGLTEASYLDLVRQDLAQNQLLGAVQASVAPSGLLTNLVFTYMNEKRQADTVFLPFAGQTPPADPGDPVLRRFYDNNAPRYTAPEYRHIKVVVLSPDTIARGLSLSDADMKVWFAQHQAEFKAPEKRSLQVVTTSTADLAKTLAAEWTGGASWEAIQAAAKAAGASAASLDDTTRSGVPSPELAKAAFAAALDSVTGPIQEPLGFQLVRVTKIDPARNPGFADLTETIRQRLGAEKAADLIDARAQKFQDIFAGGAKIDEIPSDLGAAGAEGTLDARGNTLDGTPAPLPAKDDLRKQIIAAAFKTNPGDAIQPTEGPQHAWYAVAVDSVTKPSLKPFDQVRGQVLADWQHDQVRHTQETAAAKLLTLVKDGHSLTSAAWGSGMTVSQTPPLERNRPQDGIPAELIQTIFTLPLGQATMVETNAGFMVASVAKIIKPDPKADAGGLEEATKGLTSALRDDVFLSYAQALRTAAKPTVNAQALERLIQQDAE